WHGELVRRVDPQLLDRQPLQYRVDVPDRQRHGLELLGGDVVALQVDPAHDGEDLRRGLVTGFEHRRAQLAGLEDLDPVVRDRLGQHRVDVGERQFPFHRLVRLDPVAQQVDVAYELQHLVRYGRAPLLDRYAQMLGLGHGDLLLRQAAQHGVEVAEGELRVRRLPFDPVAGQIDVAQVGDDVARDDARLVGEDRRAELLARAEHDLADRHVRQYGIQVPQLEGDLRRFVRGRREALQGEVGHEVPRGRQCLGGGGRAGQVGDG